jgi:hypothetical protein
MQTEQKRYRWFSLYYYCSQVVTATRARPSITLQPCTKSSLDEELGLALALAAPVVVDGGVVVCPPPPPTDRVSNTVMRWCEAGTDVQPKDETRSWYKEGKADYSPNVRVVVPFPIFVKSILLDGPEVDGAATWATDLTPMYEAFQDESKASMLDGIGAKGMLCLEHTFTPKVMAPAILESELLNASWHQLQLSKCVSACQMHRARTNGGALTLDLRPNTHFGIHILPVLKNR